MMVNQILESQIMQKSWEQGNRAVNIIQLFNGSAGNRSNNFPLGIGKDQSVGNKALWSFPIPREKLFDLLPALPLNKC